MLIRKTSCKCILNVSIYSFDEALVYRYEKNHLQQSELPKGKALDISLDIVPSEHSYFKYKKLEDEGKRSFERLTDFLSWHHISRSVNT